VPGNRGSRKTRLGIRAVTARQSVLAHLCLVAYQSTDPPITPTDVARSLLHPNITARHHFDIPRGRGRGHQDQQRKQGLVRSIFKTKCDGMDEEDSIKESLLGLEKGRERQHIGNLEGKGSIPQPNKKSFHRRASKEVRRRRIRCGSDRL
jgi:hypothetical protein